MSYASNPHKHGRPTRADSPTQTISIRLTLEELAAVDKRAKTEPRAVLIRRAMAQAGLFGPRMQREALEGA